MNALLGTWRMTRQEAIREDGSVYFPRGEHATGILTYDAKGFMAVQLYRAGFSGRDLDDYATAMNDFLTYFGSYEVISETQTVHHHIQRCSYSAWNGKRLTRTFELAGDALTLKNIEVADGRRETRMLYWTRIA